jgi:hypothetical protein
VAFGPLLTTALPGSGQVDDFDMRSGVSLTSCYGFGSCQWHSVPLLTVLPRAGLWLDNVRGSVSLASFHGLTCGWFGPVFAVQAALLLALRPPALFTPGALFTPCPFLPSVTAFSPETSLSSAFLLKRLLGIPLSAGCFCCTPEVLTSLGGGRVNVLGVLSPSRSALRECE